MRSGRERESTREEAQRESGGDWGRVSGVGYAVEYIDFSFGCAFDNTLFYMIIYRLYGL
jgi:hypothetical protein